MLKTLLIAVACVLGTLAYTQRAEAQVSVQVGQYRFSTSPFYGHNPYQSNRYRYDPYRYNRYQPYRYQYNPYQYRYNPYRLHYHVIPHGGHYDLVPHSGRHYYRYR